MSHKNHYGRRKFFKTVSAAGIALGSASVFANPATPQNMVPFYGTHQAGITTPQQKHLYFLVADLHSTDITEIKKMFSMWTLIAANLTQNKNAKPHSSNIYIPPADTGEAASLQAHNLTLTFGVSPSFFTKLNIETLKPLALVDLPHFSRDQLRKEYIGGDICIQACADDPQVAFHAVRNLVRAARGQITMRWAQMGFTSYDAANETPRNLFAFKDGTANLTGSDLDAVVWAQDESWFKGGSYLVARKIRMFIETWDRTSLAEQHNTFGRIRDSGAPMGQKNEHDPIDILLKDEKGEYVMPENSHVHLAFTTGHKILRRSYSYVGGIDAYGQFDTGLMFLAYQREPQAFIDIQNAFGNEDKLNEYITHIGSGIFACFAGVKDENDTLGSALFNQI